jgi:hypothetical protein
MEPPGPRSAVDVALLVFFVSLALVALALLAAPVIFR